MKLAVILTWVTTIIFTVCVAVMAWVFKDAKLFGWWAVPTVAIILCGTFSTREGKKGKDENEEDDDE